MDSDTPAAPAPLPIPPPDGSPAPAAPDGFHAGVVCIVGRANTGKSSFLNAVLGEKVAAVSPVAQTTRRTTRGILNKDGLQIVFLDTPGIRQATHRLGTLLNRNARAQVAGSDAVCLLLDASVAPQDEDIGWMRKLARDPIPVYALLNKCDLKTRPAPYKKAWDDVLDAYRSRDAAYAQPPIEWHEISASTGAGISELVDALSMRIPEAAPLFDPEILTDDPLPFFISDIIRAHFNQRLTRELPHALAIAVESIGPASPDAPPDAPPVVNATIYVEKPTQRPILLGQKGRLLRSVRIAAERELRDLLGTSYKLNLWIKVEPDWSKNYWILKKLGYVAQ